MCNLPLLKITRANNNFLTKGQSCKANFGIISGTIRVNIKIKVCLE